MFMTELQGTGSDITVDVRLPCLVTVCVSGWHLPLLHTSKEEALAAKVEANIETVVVRN